MRIIFLQDSGPILQTGNEYYPAGTRADLRDDGAEWLIANGYARPAVVEAQPVVDEPVAVPEPAKEPEPAEQAVDYATMKIAELRTLAKDKGVYRSNMKKADLVAALESEG